MAQGLTNKVGFIYKLAFENKGLGYIVPKNMSKKISQIFFKLKNGHIEDSLF